jgi:serine/threonine protein kinase
MGNFFTAHDCNASDADLSEHPLLLSVDVPVNRFCDHFASALDSGPADVALAPESRDAIEFDGFRTLSAVGRGASGFVYKAVDIETGQTVALKVHKRSDRFATEIPREVYIAQQLDHPRILQILRTFEIQRTRESLYVAVLPFAESGSLCQSNVPTLTTIAAVELLLQIGDALAYMHSLNIVHRDIKPQNILVFDDGFRLCDFSVTVALTDTNQILNDQYGTSVFMAEKSPPTHTGRYVSSWNNGLLFTIWPFAVQLNSFF